MGMRGGWNGERLREIGWEGREGGGGEDVKFGFGGSGTKSKGKGKGSVFRLLTQRAEPVSGNTIQGQGNFS